MAVISRNGRALTGATQDDVLQATKAVHDRLEGQLSNRFAKQMDRFDKQLEVELESLRSHLRKELEEEYERRLARGLAESERRHVEMMEQVKAMYHDFFVRERTEQDGRLEQVKALYQDRFDAFQQAREEMMTELKDFLKSWPTFNVTIPEQSPPIVNVHPAEMPAPVFQVPSSPAPEIRVDARPRLVSKSIAYDDMGRPQTIVEKEV